MKNKILWLAFYFSIIYCFNQMAGFPFTQIQIDELIRMQKYIEIVPSMIAVNNTHRIICNVFLEIECKKNINMRISAEIPINPIMQSVINPSCCLLYFNQRIRGINWHLLYKNSNGEIIENWHEHIWTGQEGIKYVVSVHLSNLSLGQLFEFCLNRWNIKATKESMPRLFGEK